MTYWENTGNSCAGASRWWKAYEAYTKGLEKEPGNVTMIASRALVSMKLKNFEEALKDTEAALLIDPLHTKAMFRKATILLKFQRYKEVVTYLSNAIRPLSPGQEKMKLFRVFQGANELNKQSETGKFYNLREFKGFPSRRGRRMAEFTKAVKISQIPGKNRGLVATMDIPAGGTVLVTKAFALTPEDTKESTSAALKEILMDEVIKKLRRDHDLIEDALHLWAGAKLKCIEKGAASMASVNSSDIDRIAQICNLNSWSVNYDAPGHDFKNTVVTPRCTETSKVMGLWLLPSYINHSCIEGNCSIQYYGEFQFIRAFKPIECGEEILISYVNPTMLWRQRKQKLMELEVPCDCLLCKKDMEETDDMHEEREKLLNSLLGTNLSDEQMFQVCYTLEKMRLSCAHLNIFIANVYHKVCGALYGQNDHNEGRRLFVERLYHLTHGTVLNHLTPMITLNGLTEAICFWNDEDILIWIKRFKEALIVMYGSTVLANHYAQWQVKLETDPNNGHKNCSFTTEVQKLFDKFGFDS